MSERKVDLPERLKQDGIRFAKVMEEDKKPFEQGWQEDTNYRYNDPELQGHLEGGGNYGVVGGFDNIVIVDADQQEVEDLVEQNLPETFKVRTGGGGAHFYFRCPDLENPIRLKDNQAGDVGDVQSHGKLAIGPDSIHPSGNRYEVVNDRPIADTKADDIRDALSEYLTGSKNTEEEREQIQRRTEADDFDDLELRMIDVADLSSLDKNGAEFHGEHPVHGSSTGINFWINTKKNVWHCFRHDTGGGPLMWIAVKEGILDCSEATSGALTGETFVEAVEAANEHYGADIQLQERDIIKKETENFHITIREPYKDGDKLRARVEADYKDGNQKPYYSPGVLLSSKSVNEFAKSVCVVNELDEDDYKDEVKRGILQSKTEAEDIASVSKSSTGSSDSMKATSELVKQVIRDIYHEDGIHLDDMTNEYPNIREVIDKNPEYLLLNQGVVELTDKGKAKAEQLLGLDVYDSEDEVREIADKTLETDPLGYFLKSIDKVHKGDRLLKIWELCSALSARVSERQIHSWAVGVSGKGKSHIKRQIIKYLPDDYYLKPNSLSPKAMLYYTKQEGVDVFKNKLVFFDEAESYNQEETITLLRALTDQDEDLVEHMTVKDQNPQTLRIEKPMTVWFTSVQSLNDEQLKNRFILTNPDSSEDLDEEVLKHQKNRLHYGQSLNSKPDEIPVFKEVIESILEDTDNLRLVVPFDVEWYQTFNRRLYPYFHALLEILTKVHYRNRVIVDDYIIATKADFKLAAEIWGELIDTTIAQVDRESIKLVEALPGKQAEAVTTSELSQALEGFGTQKVYDKAMHVMETEELELINGRKKGNEWKFWAGSDREKLVDPEPAAEFSEEYVEDVLETVGIEPEDEVVEAVLNEEIELDNEELDIGDVKIKSEQKEQKEQRDKLEDYEDLYPESEPRSYFDIEQEAEEELGVDPEKFRENIHEELKQMGRIYEPKKGMWMLA